MLIRIFSLNGHYNYAKEDESHVAQSFAMMS